MKKTILIYHIILLALSFSSCSDFLKEKSSARLTIPSTLKDMQALLEHPTSLNGNDAFEGEASSDDLFVPEEQENNLIEEDENLYKFANEYVNAIAGNTWYWCYTNLYRMNTVLDHLSSIDRSSHNFSEWDDVKGQAHFWRAHFYFQLATVYCLPYAYNDKINKLGLPLRRSTDFNKFVGRSSLEETYLFIIEDLKSASQLLNNPAAHVVRPSKQAAMGLLARVYMSIGDYENMFLYADSCLMYGNELLDFNTIDIFSNYPIVSYSNEILFHSVMRYNQLVRANSRISPELLELYNENDLRKNVFYNQNSDGYFVFKGNYSGTAGYFSGVSINEVVLMKIEGLIRKNRLKDASLLFNLLMENRFKTGSWKGINFIDQKEALNILYTERRKELAIRGLRWLDIRRMNMEEEHISITHRLKGQEYVLNAGSERFALPIPEEVIERGGINQNKY